MIFAIKIFDVPDSGALRDIHRQAHLDYLAQSNAQTHFAGPFLDLDSGHELGSYRLVEFPDRAAAEKHVEDEPFILGGAQKGWTVYPWRPGVPHTYRDCPRKEGNVQFFIHALDRADGAGLRNELQEAHGEYLRSRPEAIITRGPLLSDDGERKIGSNFILDMPDLAAAKELWDNEPFNKNGLYGTVEFYGWRFGRIFDRLKGAS
ncbi:YciI family protein [Nitrospinota bacterium]